MTNDAITPLRDRQGKISADADVIGIALVCATELLKRTMEMAQAEGYGEDKLTNLKEFFLTKIDAELSAIVERKWQ